jgi:hypothetical protein
MNRFSDVRPVATRFYFLPVETRVPLKFGPETLTYVTCARARGGRRQNGAQGRGVERDAAQRSMGMVE